MRSRTHSKSPHSKRRRPFFEPTFVTCTTRREGLRQKLCFEYTLSAPSIEWRLSKSSEDFTAYSAQMSREWRSLKHKSTFPPLPRIQASKVNSLDYLNRIGEEIEDWLRFILSSKRAILHERSRNFLQLPDEAAIDVERNQRFERKPLEDEHQLVQQNTIQQNVAEIMEELSSTEHSSNGLLDALGRGTSPQTPLKTATRLLVHTVTYDDMYVMLRIGDETTSSLLFMARPKREYFTFVCEALHNLFETKQSILVGLTEKNPKTKTSEHVGFSFPQPVALGKWHHYETKEQLPSAMWSRRFNLHARIESVVFPSVSALIPKWIEFVPSLHWSGTDTRIFFTCGTDQSQLAQIPRERDDRKTEPSDSISYASTQPLAILLQQFIHTFHRQPIVVDVFNCASISDYTENINFVHGLLRPRINEHRSQLAGSFGETWKKFFHLSITLVKNAGANLAVLSSGLRQFDPDMFQIDDLNDFVWNNYPSSVSSLWTDQISYIPFHTVSTFPPLPLMECDHDVQAVVNELLAWRREFLETIGRPRCEIAQFWIRKSHQAMLCVLMVQKEGDREPRFFRGVNMEVSMPTGSLCAERDAVGTALASDPSLTRAEFKMVAVLAIPKSRVKPMGTAQLGMMSPAPPDVDPNPRDPCGACSEWLKKVAEVNPSFRVVTVTDQSCQRVIVKYLIA